MRINITCPSPRLVANARNRERLAACRGFRATDRVPVLTSLSTRFCFHARGESIGDYYVNPRTQVEQQLLNQKWLIENAVDDRVINEESVTVAPDLDTLRGGYFDVGMRWFNDGSASAVPILHRPEDIDALTVPDVGNGPYGRNIAWYHQMKGIVSEHEVTLNGVPMEIQVSIRAGGGPIPDAYALAGQNLFLWMRLCPERIHRLMGLLATAFINLQHHVRDLQGDSHENLGMGCDAGEMLSAEMFREFVVPYYRRCYAAFPGRRGLHMCGRIDHLLPVLAEELQITDLNGFGFPTDPELLAEWMGGKVVMSGGIHPGLLAQGSVEEIKRECLRYLEVFAPHGGYILQDGANVAPGTPMRSLSAMVQASVEFASRA